MADLFHGAALAASGMKAQAQRLRLVAENVANADTPGYHRKTTTFEQVLSAGRPTGEVQAGPVRLDPREGEKIYDPGSPMADPSGHYYGSNVEMIVEIADAREAQRSYEANLRLFDQARQMSRSLLELLRR